MNATPETVLFKRSLLSLACVACLCAGSSALAAGHEGPSWREFARRSMMPDYAWNNAPSAQSLAPTLRDQVFGARGQSLTLALSGGGTAVQRSLTVSFGEAAGHDKPGSSVTGPVDLTARGSPLRNQFLDATFEQDFTGGSRLGVSALVARQQFATPGFGLARGIADSVIAGYGHRSTGVAETVSGHGMRLNYQMPMGERTAWLWTAQSKLEMNPFESVRGIYAEPGDFDLPARLGTQFEWQATPGATLALGMERVYFSQVTPFTSAALPMRLLSLMGDGNAPAFAWRDLTVYSAEARFADRWQGQWLARYSTRQQPSPTIELYQRALASEYTDTNLMFGYRRHLGGAGELALTASYAPSMAFLGPGPVFASRTYSQGAVAEFEALWVVPF